MPTAQKDSVLIIQHKTENHKKKEQRFLQKSDFKELKLDSEFFYNILVTVAQTEIILHNVVCIFHRTRTHTYIYKHMLSPRNKQYQKYCQNSCGLSVNFLELTHPLYGQRSGEQFRAFPPTQNSCHTQVKIFLLVFINSGPSCGCHIKL